MRFTLIAVAVLGLAGCGSFGAGYRDQMAKEGLLEISNATADGINKLLGPKFDGLAESVRKLPDGMPKPPPAEKPDLQYYLGVAAAMVTALGIRGGVRRFTDANGKRKEAA